MARKKWTAKTEITEALVKFREKRKWQLGFRRYVLEKMPAEAYAPYFGLDIKTLRQWFELQFTEGLHWENFGKAWQFEHIVPAACFDYSNESDLRLCWSFINIRIEKTESPENQRTRIDLLAAKSYFRHLYDKTGFSVCLAMLEKIERIEASARKDYSALENFLLKNKEDLENISSLSPDEFNRLNKGFSLPDLLLEKEILRKFGSGKNA